MLGLWRHAKINYSHLLFGMIMGIHRKSRVVTMPILSALVAREIIINTTFITAISNGRHGVSNYHSIECLFNSLFKLTTKEHQRSALLSFCVWGIHRWPVVSPHKGTVTRKMFPFDDVIMIQYHQWWNILHHGDSFFSCCIVYVFQIVIKNELWHNIRKCCCLKTLLVIFQHK